MTLLFILSLALAATGNYELVVVGMPAETSCAKSRDSCEAARKAIAEGKLKPMTKGLIKFPEKVKTHCRPAPNCFSDISNCIKGFNCVE